MKYYTILLLLLSGVVSAQDSQFREYLTDPNVLVGKWEGIVLFYSLDGEYRESWNIEITKEYRADGTGISTGGGLLLIMGNPSPFTWRRNDAGSTEDSRLPIVATEIREMIPGPVTYNIHMIETGNGEYIQIMSRPGEDEHFLLLRKSEGEQ
jgi:hypothetical protein